MSGALCQSCGCPYLADCPLADPSWQIPVQCKLCGWKGDVFGLPRKKLTKESYDTFTHDIELKEAGKLFFLTIIINHNDPEMVRNSSSAIMERLGLKIMNSSGTNPCRCRIRMDHRPEEALLQKIKKVQGVTGIEVY